MLYKFVDICLTVCIYLFGTTFLMMKKLNFGLIGYGYWGQNLARVIHENELCNLVAISDLNPRALNELDIKLNNVEIFNNYESILSLPYIDAVVVATPVSTHYNIVKSALIHGKHVLCEKILSNSVS